MPLHGELELLNTVSRNPIPGPAGASYPGQGADDPVLILDLPPFERGYIEIAWHKEFVALRSLNQALTRHVRAHPSLVLSPQSHATRGGMHTGQLLVDPKGPFGAFEGILWKAVREYMDSIGLGADHPFLKDPPDFDVIACWNAILPSQRRQVPHIHPAAWLSGVYYSELPTAIDRENSTDGWIEFGAPPENFKFKKEIPLRLIKPKEGFLVMFSSYFYHRTLPFEGDEERVSIAFDFVPEFRAASSGASRMTRR